MKHGKHVGLSSARSISSWCAITRSEWGASAASGSELVMPTAKAPGSTKNREHEKAGEVVKKGCMQGEVQE